jgi:hypothetical protein
MSEALRLLLVNRPPPDPLGGGGGHHRSYQLKWELENAFGEEAVTAICCANDVKFGKTEGKGTVDLSLRDGVTGLPGLTSLRLFRQYLTNPCFYRQNPHRLVVNTGFSTDADVLKADFINRYRKCVEGPKRPDVVVIDDSRLGVLVAINVEHGIPTVGSMHNLESLDAYISIRENNWGLGATLGDLSAEYAALAKLDACMLISKVETGLLTGLGLDVSFHPYLPRGIVRERFMKIRELRQGASIEKGMFVVMGSARHSTTGESMRWLTENAVTHGLPKACNLIFLGRGTRKVLADIPQVSDIQIKDWVEEDVLVDMLSRAEGVLIPQQMGFGAVTRVADMACAGIPTITSEHATLAINVPPGVSVAANNWKAWREQMSSLVANRKAPDHEAYETWVAAAPSPLPDVVRHVVNATRKP